MLASRSNEARMVQATLNRRRFMLPQEAPKAFADAVLDVARA
jgi:hypothetical protein